MSYLEPILVHPVRRQNFRDAVAQKCNPYLIRCLNHEYFRRQQEDQVEAGKELMRQEFTEWLNQVPENFPNLILCQLNVAGGDGGGGE